MNEKQKTAMQQLIDYIDLLDSKGLPEYTLAIATRLKAIELLEEEKRQLKECFDWDFDFFITNIEDTLNFEHYYTVKFNNNEN